MENSRNPAPPLAAATRSFTPYRSRHNGHHQNWRDHGQRAPGANVPNVSRWKRPGGRQRNNYVRASQNVQYSQPRHNPLPKDWLHLNPVGNPINEVPFICFKTPFDRISSYPQNLRSEAFCTKRLFEELEKKSVRLGLVIDLTNTDRYYNPSSFICKGIPVIKLHTPGKTVPPLSCYRRFHEEVSKRIQHCLENEKKIGVHCTHGINRTGWFICRFMMDEMQFTAEEAIRIFGEARGHHIYRDYILEDLKRYNARNETVQDAIKLENSKN